MVEIRHKKRQREGLYCVFSYKNIFGVKRYPTREIDSYHTIS